MTNKNRLLEDIEKALNKELNPRESILICEHTPKILIQLGLNDYPILFSQSHVRNCLHPKGNNPHWHGLDKGFLSDIESHLENPCVVYDSLGRDDSVVLVLNAVDSEGLPIIASLDFDGIGQYHFKKINSNYLTSVYGHENIEGTLTKAMDLNFILYVNEKNTTELGNLSKLPLLRGLPQLGYKGIIHKSENFINYYKSRTFEDEVAEAAEKMEAQKNVGSNRTSKAKDER